MNNHIINQADKISMLSEKDLLTKDDYEKIHAFAWDIQVIAERNLRRMI